MIHLESITLLLPSQLVSFKGKSSLSPVLELVLDNYKVSFWLWVSKTSDSHTEWYPKPVSREASRTHGGGPAWPHTEPLHPHYELREVLPTPAAGSVPQNQAQHRFLSGALPCWSVFYMFPPVTGALGCCWQHQAAEGRCGKAL